jgi:hypothetical protein
MNFEWNSRNNFEIPEEFKNYFKIPIEFLIIEYHYNYLSPLEKFFSVPLKTIPLHIPLVVYKFCVFLFSAIKKRSSLFGNTNSSNY